MNENIANFIGREGFNWWIGQIENDGARHWNAKLQNGSGGWDYSDWDWTNKVKVRIVGYHNPNRKELPCLLYTSPSPRDRQKSRMPSSA